MTKRKPSLVNVVAPPMLPAQVNTVKGKSVPYSKRQQHDALKVQQLRESMGCPTIADLKAMVQANQIKNDPITLQDIEVMDAIDGPHVPSIKGKTTRSKTTHHQGGLCGHTTRTAQCTGTSYPLRGYHAREWHTIPHCNLRPHPIPYVSVPV